jgi:dTDP-4-dehydrorhamnose reductase
MGAGRSVSALVVGASGQVGHHLGLAAERRGLPWCGTFNSCPAVGLEQLDMRDAAAVSRMVRRASPEFVIVPAAAANVDRCETAPRETYDVNVRGTSHIVNAANEAEATVVYFSSDFVFDGVTGPYDESEPANPTSQYGLQKLSAEHVVLQRAREAMIVRTTVVYGHEPQRKNFIYRVLASLRSGQRIAVPADQVGTPTYAPALADAVFDLLQAGVRGVINVAGRELVTREEFARAAASAFGEDPALVQPTATAALKQAARRPLNGGLRSEFAERCLGRQLPGYVEGLRRMSTEHAI